MTSESYAQLLSLAVHEMRTPAGIVGGYLRMLQRDTTAPLNERQKKMVDEAERSCQRLVELISELSEVQRLDAERVELAQQSFDVFGVIEQAAAAVQIPEDRGVRLELRGPSEGAPARGDAARLQRAYHAIFRAIVREMPENSRVVGERRVETRDGARAATLVVADERHLNGAWTTDAVPFDEKRGGLGLALPIARRVIEHHGGRIWSPPGDAARSVAIVSLPIVGSHP
jgi:cell cycle sensor histidine kinase DivJ